VESARRELENARASLAAATERHAPAALAEVRGLPALAAEQLERGDVEPALAMIRRVDAHLVALERAAATARPLLEAAEEAVDDAVARGDAAGARAAELTAAARAELASQRPDWLELVARVERARRLLEGEPSTRPRNLGPMRERARAGREDVWAWALTAGPRAELARGVANEVDLLLDAADRAGADGDDARAQALYLQAAAAAEAAVEDASRPPTPRARAGRTVAARLKGLSET
jgi:hypothetical protein